MLYLSRKTKTFSIGMDMNKKLAILLALGTLGFFGCIALCMGVFIYGLLQDPNLSFNHVREQLASLPDMKSKLEEQYPKAAVELEVSNGHVLHVRMINSGHLKLSETKRREEAVKIGKFIVNNYRSIDTIDMIVIDFVERISMMFSVEKFLTYNLYVDDFR